MSEKISRKNLTNEEFLKLRQTTEKIDQVLNKRLRSHLDIIRPLFIPRILLGNFVKSAYTDEIPGTQKAFTELQEWYAKICEKPFGLPKKLQPPLSPISHQLEMTPFQYPLSLEGARDRSINITSPVKWILSYQSDCPFNRLKAMALGMESRQPDEMRQGLISHLTMVIFLRRFPILNQLFEDLRYQPEIIELSDLGGLPVVILKAPVETFLPPDDFILQVTQLSGIAAFQEIIVLEAVENIADPFKENLKNLIK